MRHAVITIVLCLPFVGRAEQRMVKVGERRMSIDCDGYASRSPTVILMAGAGRTAKDWAKVQPAVSKFDRVCSYDRAGLGESEKPSKPQTTAEIIDDLHNLLNAAGEKPPYILVGHSLAGIFARRFTTKFPREVGALVMVDSSHEEQFWRMHELDPKGPPLRDDLSDVFFGKPGQRLEWRTEVPMIVLAQGKAAARPADMSEKVFVAFGRIWRELQQDLATRSPHGQFRLAEKSGHFIQIDQPELVIQAIRELSQ